MATTDARWASIEDAWRADSRRQTEYENEVLVMGPGLLTPYETNRDTPAGRPARSLGGAIQNTGFAGVQQARARHAGASPGPLCLVPG